MAQGRMIVTAIGKDKEVNALSSDTSRLAFTWLIPFADREGRTYGDPAIVRSMIFPRREDITIEMMEGFIKEWAVHQLIVWYEVNGDLYIWFPSFDKNQPGLRKDREAESRIPEPPQNWDELMTELLRSNDGDTTEQLPVKLKEVKLNNKKLKATPAPAIIDSVQAIQVFTEVTGMLTIPGRQDEKGNVIDKICSLWGLHQSETVVYLKPFYDAWIGRNYNKTNTAWLDWAIAGEIPVPKAPDKPNPLEGYTYAGK